MNTQEWIQLSSGVAFPIAVAWFLLVRLQGSLDSLTKALHELIARMPK